MSTIAVANFVAWIGFDKLPETVISQAKKGIRDIIGVMIAAHQDKAVQAVRRFAIAMGGKEESTLIGIDKKLPCNTAALVNSAMASTLDMDDGSYGLEGHPRFTRGHPGGIIVPSCLAVAERENVTGKTLVEATVIGYEIALSTAWMLGEVTGESFAAGSSGTYGASAAAAKLLGLGQQEIVDAFGIAEAHCPLNGITWDRSPNIFIWKEANMTKESSAWAAMTGVSAALLAQAGFCGGRTTYDLPEVNKKPIEMLGKEWEILGLYFKTHSMCRSGHSAVDGVLEIVRNYKIDAEDISKIRVGTTHQRGGRMSNYRPTNIWKAQYSIPFAIGAALVDGEVGPKQMAENRLNDKAILSQADKVEIVLDTEVSALFPGTRAARIEVETKQGNRFQTFIRSTKGNPENPYTDEELKEKFMKLVAEMIGTPRAEGLYTCIDNIEDLKNVNELIERIRYL